METQRARLVRRKDDRVIAGVCSGIGDHFGIDPVVVRIGAIVLTIFGGAGILAYLAAWVIIPAEGEERAIADGVLRERRTGQIFGWLLIAAAVLAIGGRLWWGGFFTFPLILIGLGVLLLWHSGQRDDDQPGEPPPPPPPPEPWTDTVPIATTSVQSSEGRERVRRRARRRGRSGLPLVAIGVLLAGAGIVGLVLAAGDSVDPSRVFAGGVFVVGAAMVAGTWFGRSGTLIPLGLILLASMSVATLIRVPFEGGLGDKREQPVRVAELDDAYRLAIGELELDMSNLAMTSGSTETVTATVGIGDLHIVVPDGVEVRAHAEAGAGNVRLFGRENDGINVERDETLDAAEGSPVLVLDAEVGLGNVRIERASS